QPGAGYARHQLWERWPARGPGPPRLPCARRGGGRSRTRGDRPVRLPGRGAGGGARQPQRPRCGTGGVPAGCEGGKVQRYEQVESPGRSAGEGGRTMKVREDPAERTVRPEPRRTEVAPPRVPRAVVPRPVPKNAPLDHPALYFNHELGWLDFNWRVLVQARDERLPLLERVRFLAIASRNLDEFYQKRVGGLKRQSAAGVTRLSYDGRTPDEQLRLVLDAALEMQEVMSTTWLSELRPLLKENGIVISDYEEL